MADNKKIKLLETLHTVLIRELLGRIESGEAKPGDLNVARQLLKDNGIECIPTEKSPMEAVSYTHLTLPTTPYV